MIPAAGTTVSELKAVLELLKETFGLRDPDQFRVKAVQLQEAILAAQEVALSERESRYELTQKIEELKGRLSELDDWRQEARRYELRDFGNNTFAYELRLDDARGEPVHKLCPVCFQKRTKSILQRSGGHEGQIFYNCLACNNRIPLGAGSRRMQNSDYRSDF